MQKHHLRATETNPLMLKLNVKGYIFGGGAVLFLFFF